VALFVAQGLALAMAPALFPARLTPHSAPASAAPPPSSNGIFPLSEVRSGMTGTAWTVFTGSKPEPMGVEILGVLRGVRGPGQDMILAQLHGARPEYTGVVEGMSGSPVYIGGKLLGSLSYRIGDFSKDPIAGITPIEQMLEVRDLPLDPASTTLAGRGPEPVSIPSAIPDRRLAAREMNFQEMGTPLVMSGFRPEAVRLWQQQMAGTSLEQVAAGGMGASTVADARPSAAAQAALEPGSAVSAQLVRGDLEVSATCTVTYIDPRQLLACGHPILQQAGPVSLPMTTAEVVATVSSPLDPFKIINTGATIGAFTEDRDSAIRGLLGVQARMIPMHIKMDEPGGERMLNVEILDLPSMTPLAVQVVLLQALLESNQSTALNSYHLTGSIDLEGYAPSPIDLWAASGEATAAPMEAALRTGERFSRLYASGARQGTVRGIDLEVEAIPRYVQMVLENARLVANSTVHAGDTVEVEATIRPWRQPARNLRIALKIPARLGAGNLRLLVSDAGTLDRALDQPRIGNRPPDLKMVLEQARRQHPADRIYVSLLAPEAQARIDGQTLTSLPLSMANALEPGHVSQQINLNGESAELAAEAPAGGVLSGFVILNLHIEPGGGLN
jgi:hypothetical protein